MINIYINNKILERHRAYLKESTLLQNISQLLSKELLSDLNKNFGKPFVNEHIAFCNRLCQEYKNMNADKNENIFLGTPTYLNTFIQNVYQQYGEVQKKIEEDNKYADYFSQAFEYDRFVNSHGPTRVSMKDKRNDELTDPIKAYTLENFDDEKENFKWGAYAYVLSLKTTVCPYCNRSYVTPLYSENGKMRADLDHFFTKSRYPYLSISIFNLVPSCKYCNSSLKGNKEFTYKDNFHPLDSTRADRLYRITYMPKSTGCFLGKEDFDIVFEYYTAEKNWKKMKGNNDILKIEEIYQYHKDIVSNLIKKRYIYDDGYIEYLWKTYPNLFSSREEVITFLLAPYDISQTESAPLGKLIKDLIEELNF